MDIGVIVSALGAGLLSFFSPCVLPLMPIYVGILASDAGGEKGSSSRRALNTAAFVLGVSLTFVAMGVGAGAIGSVLANPYVAIAAGLLVFLLGLQMAGVLKIPFLEQTKVFNVSSTGATGAPKAFLLGLALSFGWTPCVGPILGSILVLAGSEGSLVAGGLLLFIYSMGLCLPFLALTLAYDALVSYFSRIKKWLPKLQVAGGVVIAIAGLWMVFAQVNTLVNVASVDVEDEVPAVSDVVAADAGDASSAPAGAEEALGISPAWKNVVLTDLDGNKVRFSDLKGKPVYFEFWGTWCSSCVSDLGQLNDLYARHEEAGDVQVISVVTPGSYGEKDAEEFVAWARENGVTFPVYMDKRASLVSYIGVRGFPTSVFVDSSGSVVAVRVGAVEMDELEELLAQLS